MAGVREIRVTTTDGKNATVRLEYEDGFTHVILRDQLSLTSPLDPAAAKNPGCQSAKGAWHRSDEYRARSNNRRVASRMRKGPHEMDALSMSIISRLNAGMSSGLRLEMRFRSTTTVRSPHSAPAFCRSVLSEGQDVIRRPLRKPVAAHAHLVRMGSSVRPHSHPSVDLALQRNR
jgi:hypothetical protein